MSCLSIKDSERRIWEFRKANTMHVQEEAPEANWKACSCRESVPGPELVTTRL